MKAPRFEGKVALVTGAGSGLGEAIAAMLHAEGARVALLDHDEAAITALARRMDERTRAFPVDVANEQAVDRTFNQVLAWGGGLDLAVNNAGINQPPAPLWEVGVDDWRRVLDVNLTGIFLCLRREMAAMRKTGGAIVNMASALGTIGIANAAAYVTSKHGVIGLTRSAAIEGAAAGIRVNAVAPGLIRTPLVERVVTPERQQAMAALHPQGRLGTPDEIASLTTFLVSDAASFITGSVHVADGGWTAW